MYCTDLTLHNNAPTTSIRKIFKKCICTVQEVMGQVGLTNENNWSSKISWQRQCNNQKSGVFFPVLEKIFLVVEGGVWIYVIRGVWYRGDRKVTPKTGSPGWWAYLKWKRKTLLLHTQNYCFFFFRPRYRKNMLRKDFVGIILLTAASLLLLSTQLSQE